MRILVISQYFVPDITAAAFRIGDLARLFAEDDHKVVVLTAEPHKAQAQDESSEAMDERVEVMRCRIRGVRGGGMREYIVHYLSFVFGSVRKGMALWWRGWKPDVIFVTSPPLFAGLSGRFLSVLFRRPMVFEVRDIWPDTAVAAGQLSAKGRGYRIGRMLEKHLYRKALHITCVSQPMRSYIQGETTTPVSVVYNGVMADQVDPPRPDSTPTSHRTILYAGNIGHLQELDLLVRGFSELNQQGEADDWLVRIIGAGAQRDELIGLTKDLRLGSRVLIDPAMPREQVFEEMRNADLLYLSLKRDPTLERTIPSKVFDYMLAARPIVAGLAGEGYDILNETGANVCFEPGNLEKLKNALRDAFDRQRALRARSKLNRQLVLERFTRQRSAQALLEIFREVTEKES